MTISVRMAAGVLLTAAVLAACATSPPEKTVAGAEKRIAVARVNGVAITMDALVSMMNRLGPPQEGDPAAATEEIRTKALDRLIFQELAVQQAAALAVTPDPAAVDAALANFKVNLGGDEEFQAYLAAQGLSEEDLRSQVRRSLTLEQMYKREVLDRIVLPEDEIKAEYEREKHRFIKRERLVVIDVLFLQKPDDPATARKAQAVLKKIRQDRNRDPWQLMLDGTFQVRTLEVRKDRHPELYAQARKLKPGELSGVVRTPAALHIIKLKEHEPERQFTLEETRKLLEGKFRVRAQEARMQEWEQELRKNATVEILYLGPTQTTPDGR